jgi:hypothetical protein
VRLENVDVADEGLDKSGWMLSVLTTVAGVADTEGVTVSVGLSFLTALVDNNVVLRDAVFPAVCFGPSEPRRLISDNIPGTTHITVRIRIKIIAAFLFII